MTEEKLKLPDSQKELLKNLIKKGITKKPNLKNIQQKLYGNKQIKTDTEKLIHDRIKRLEHKLENHGITIQSNTEDKEYWVEFSDLNERGWADEFEEKPNKNLSILYLSPGKLGIGTKLFELKAAKGLNIFLKNNKPFAKGKQVSDKPIIEYMDAVFIMGGLIPKIPYNFKSQEGRYQSWILAQLSEDEMSEERLKNEKSRLEKIASSANYSEDVLEIFKREAYGTISNLEEAATKSNSTLKDLLDGFKGPIYYQPGEQDINNKEVLRKRFEEEIKEHRKEINRNRRTIKSNFKKIKKTKTKKIIASHILDILREAEDYIFSNEKRINKEFNTNVYNMQHSPRKGLERTAFEVLFQEYMYKVENRLKNGYVNWKDPHFEDMNKNEKEHFKNKYAMEISNNSLAALNICRTYYGLGWRRDIKISKIFGSKGIIGGLEKDNKEKESEINKGLAELVGLGWIEDKDYKDTNSGDAILREIIVDIEMKKIYEKIAGDFDLRVLDEGISDFEIDKRGFRSEYSISSREGDKQLQEMLDDISNLGRKRVWVPDVWLKGPSSELWIAEERKYPLNDKEAPKLEYAKKSESTLLIQLGNMYTLDTTREYRRTVPGEERKKKYDPIEEESGQVPLHIKGKEKGEDQFHLLDMDDLLKLYYNENKITVLRNDKKLTEKDKERIEKLKNREKYTLKISISSYDDSHQGDADPWNQNPGDIYRGGWVKYVKENFDYPDLLKMSEIIDGAQVIRGRNLSAQHNVLSKHQYEKAIENINDKIKDDKEKTEVLEEIIRIMGEGMARPNLDEQYEEFGISSFADYLRETIENGGRAIAVSGDHPNRTTKHNGDEALSLRNLYQQAYIDLPNGERIRVADRINIAAIGEESGLMFFGDNKEYPEIFAVHKMSNNVWKQIRGAGISSKLVMAAHRHHPKISKRGKQNVIMSSGLIPRYNFVPSKGLYEGVHTVNWINTPDPQHPIYKGSISVFMASDEAIERQKGIKERIELRKKILDMEIIPPR